MLTFISCAKTMSSSEARLPVVSEPHFLAEALQHAAALRALPGTELGALLKVSGALAAENHRRYLEFGMAATPRRAAMEAYTGVVFQHIAPTEFTAGELEFAQQHLFITSFLYGLLRPLDGIWNYRLEGDVRLSENDDMTMFEFWRTRLTDFFIAEIERQGGELMNVASGEMKSLFDWKRVERSVRVFTPEFKVRKGGRLTTVTVYAKMCRGEFVRHIIRGRIDSAERMKEFAWEGFHFSEELSTERRYVYVLEA